jgi:UDP-N-acetylglucosamine 1-carboxyvinyltransferase
MDRLVIRGGSRLKGSVQIHGANAALPQMAAALLSTGPIEIGNVPDLIDVATMLKLMQEFGVTAPPLSGRRRRSCRCIASGAACSDGASMLRASRPWGREL